MDKNKKNWWKFNLIFKNLLIKKIFNKCLKYNLVNLKNLFKIIKIEKNLIFKIKFWIKNIQKNCIYFLFSESWF